jgi:hypothetical protein
MEVGPVSSGGVTGPFPEAEYQAIFQKVPRLAVEVVICSDLGMPLARRITAQIADAASPGGRSGST